jgi:hypothetical protein
MGGRSQGCGSCAFPCVLIALAELGDRFVRSSFAGLLRLLAAPWLDFMKRQRRVSSDRTQEVFRSDCAVRVGSTTVTLRACAGLPGAMSPALAL